MGRFIYQSSECLPSREDNNRVNQEGTQGSYKWKEANDHAIKRSMGGVVLSTDRRKIRETQIWMSRSSAKSRKAIVIKSLKEKWEKREQLAKVNGEKEIGGSSIITGWGHRAYCGCRVYCGYRKWGGFWCWGRGLYELGVPGQVRSSGKGENIFYWFVVLIVERWAKAWPPGVTCGDWGRSFT